MRRSITRIVPWAAVYEVKHCGFTVAWRSRDEDGDWGWEWHLEPAVPAENGVSWTQ